MYFGAGNFLPSGNNPVRTVVRRVRDMHRVKHIAIDTVIDELFTHEYNEGQGRGLVKAGLKSVESITLIGYDNIFWSDGHHVDLVLQRSELSNGEYHAWSMSHSGRVIPYRLSPDCTPLEAGFSAAWANAEEYAFDEGIGIKTFRFVPLRALHQDPRWQRRFKVRNKLVYCPDEGCL